MLVQFAIDPEAISSHASNNDSVIFEEHTKHLIANWKRHGVLTQFKAAKEDNHDLLRAIRKIPGTHSRAKKCGSPPFTIIGQTHR